jgi:hypothetical protein
MGCLLYRGNFIDYVCSTDLPRHIAHLGAKGLPRVLEVPLLLIRDYLVLDLARHVYAERGLLNGQITVLFCWHLVAVSQIQLALVVDLWYARLSNFYIVLLDFLRSFLRPVEVIDTLLGKI